MSLLIVTFGGKKKYVQLDTLTHPCFINAVREKFQIQESVQLVVSDENGVEVDEDVFPLLAAREIGFIISTKNTLLLEPVSLSTNLGQLGDGLDLSQCITLDLTAVEDENDPILFPCLSDTLPVSSSLRSEAACDTGQTAVQLLHGKSACVAKNVEVAYSVNGQNRASALQAKTIVEQILKANSAGKSAIKEYNNTGTLTEATRRTVVNVVVAAMCEKEGRVIRRPTKELHALGIVELFPSLKDPYSKKGYEHFYDIDSNSGFIQWRMKTVQRHSRSVSTPHSKVTHNGGPTSLRGLASPAQPKDECLEAMSLLQHTTDRDLVLLKMKQTFSHRQGLLRDPECSSDLLLLFPRFMDTKGLILQDFLLMFDEEISSKFLEKWNTCFKEKIIKEAQSLRETSFLRKYLQAALNEAHNPTDDPEWDSDMSSLILLLYLLSPQAAGKKRAKKIGVEEAIDHLVKFQKSFQSLEEHLFSIEGSPQPYLLAQGTSKGQVSSFYIVLDKKFIPCQSSTSLGAFDELFKCHFVFSLKYDDSLSSMYTFLQTTVYNIDIGTTGETPRVKQLRARLLSEQHLATLFLQMIRTRTFCFLNIVNIAFSHK